MSDVLVEVVEYRVGAVKSVVKYMCKFLYCG